MDWIVIALAFGLGWQLGGDRPSPPPVACPPMEYPAPPANLLRPLPLDYLLPPEMPPPSSPPAGSNAPN